MFKKLFTTSMLVLALGIITGGAAVYADEPVITSDEPTPVTNCIGNPDTNCAPSGTGGTSAITEPSDDVTPKICLDSNGVEIECTEAKTDCDDSDADCTSGINPISEEEYSHLIAASPEEEEPETWPMYVSLGALGLAILVFIVLNVFGGKKK